MYEGAEVASIVTSLEMAGSGLSRVMVPSTEKSMTADPPGEPALAPSIAARSEPAPELLRFVTTMGDKDAEVKVDLPGVWAAAAGVEMATAVDVYAAMQAAPAIRIRILDTKGASASGSLLRNLHCVVRVSIVSLLPYLVECQTGVRRWLVEQSVAEAPAAGTPGSSMARRIAAGS